MHVLSQTAEAGGDGRPRPPSPSRSHATTPGPRPPETITRLLEAWGDGDTGALEALMPRVLGELKQLARGQLSRERPGRALRPTALVHETYLQLARQRRVRWSSRRQFFAFAGTLMRRVRISRARRRRAAKRGGGADDITLCDGLAARPETLQPEELLALDQALERLARRSRRQVRVVELRFFAGLTVAETAEALGVCPATVKADWSLARAWLLRELEDGRRKRRTA